MGFWSFLFGDNKQKEFKIVCLGLDGAGKTTLLKNAAGESLRNVSPTHGFNIKSLQFDNYRLTVWDIGGHEELQPFWYTYIDDCDGLIWVIDSADNKRFLDSGSELQN